ncbi:MAG: thioredoxin [Holosporales bacterium]|jgi:thioredoxin 1|nr:thioredoxin [Holosporales bacterium]
MVDVLKSEELRDLIASNGLVVVDFWAQWCGPCRMLTGVLEDVEKAMEGVQFVKVNVDSAPDIATEYGIQTLPTIIVFKGGTEAEVKAGFMSANSLKTLINGCK